MTRATKRTTMSNSRASTIAKYARIRESVGTWNAAGDRKSNAAKVMEAAKGEGYEFHCTPAQVATLMGHMPFWSQGPDNYLDVALGLSEVLKPPTTTKEP